MVRIQRVGLGFRVSVWGLGFRVEGFESFKRTLIAVPIVVPAPMRPK